MYTAQQPFGGLTDTYDLRAVSILDGEGLLGPYNINARRTTWIAQAPGYSIFLSLIYKLTSRDFFKVQLLQNAVNSISPVMIFFIAGMLLSWRVGIAVGTLSALSHHLSYISNFILPDSLCALPILAAFLLIVAGMGYRGKKREWRVYLLYAAAGLLLGISSWLRPQPMLLGLFLILIMPLLFTRHWIGVKYASVIAMASLLVITPITIKNYLVYGAFIPVSIGTGLNLWEGIGEASNYGFGAVAKDGEVAQQEALLYQNQQYGEAWSSPDGVMRDRDRVKKSLKVIAENPLWYAGVMGKRATEMVKYSAHAPLVAKPEEAKWQELKTQESAEPVKKEWQEIAAQSRQSSLVVGRNLFWFRAALRALQRVSKEAMQIFILIGLSVVFLLSRRRTWLILITPIYYFIFQGFMHTEFRYTLPMQYFVFTFAAVTWVLMVTMICQGIGKIVNKISLFRTKKLAAS